jgi:hypothetical protein
MDMSNNSLGKSVSASLVVEQKLVTELPTVLPDQSYVVGAVTMTRAEVVAQLDQHLGAEQQLASLKAQLREALTNIKGMRAQANKTVQTIKVTSGAVLGTTNPQFETLGFTPPKLRKTTTAAEKALAAARNVATREARGTKGPRQKAAIHGTVPAPVTSPVATIPSPATPAVVK